MPELLNLSCKGTTTSLGMTQGTLVPDPRRLCWPQRQKSDHSHRCSLKIDRGLPYRCYKLNHHNWKIKVLFCQARPSNLLVSDNGPCFTSLKFAEFTRENVIKYKLVSTYHQASNDQAKSVVKIVENGLRRMSGGTLKTKLSRFLLSYRTTPHNTTGVTLAELLKKMKLQTNLDRLRPSTSATVLLN